MGRQRIEPMKPAADAIRVLGQQIRAARHDRNWTAAELAHAIGVSPATVSSIEQGSAATSIGNVFNAAVAVGVPLFGADPAELAALVRRGEERLALLPSRVDHPRGETARADTNF